MTTTPTIQCHDRITAWVNGWTIDRCPNSFAERFRYEATAVDADGYLTARHGFQSLRDAKAFCAANPAPRERA